MKGVKSLKSLMHNKVVLYAVLALAIVNLLGYLSQNNLSAILIFLVVGYAMTHVTKNMVCVLITALVITNVVSRRNTVVGYNIMEGLATHHTNCKCSSCECPEADPSKADSRADPSRASSSDSGPQPL
jgi:hypothetical protein